jgi:hypothetical protein
MFIVYLVVDFLQLPIDDMKTLLNTHTSAPYPLWQRIISQVSTNFLAGLIILVLLSFSHQGLAASFGTNSLIIAGTGSANGTYNVTFFNNINSPRTLGSSFDRSSGRLLIGAQSNTTESGNENVNRVQVLYRVYPATNSTVTSTSPAFAALPLTTTGTGRAKQWNSATQVDLISLTSGAGNYILCPNFGCQ